MSRNEPALDPTVLNANDFEWPIMLAVHILSGSVNFPVHVVDGNATYIVGNKEEAGAFLMGKVNRNGLTFFLLNLCNNFVTKFVKLGY